MSSTPEGLFEEFLTREERTETDSGRPIIETITTHRTYTTKSAPDSGKLSTTEIINRYNEQSLLNR